MDYPNIRAVAEGRKADHRQLRREAADLLARLDRWDWVDEPPPQDVDAEKAFLGALICDPGMIDKAAEILSPAHLHVPDHGELYEVLLSLRRECRAVDAVTIMDQLRRRGLSKEGCGASLVAEVVQAVPFASHWRYYAEIVLRTYARRSICASCLEEARLAHVGRKPIGEIARHGGELFCRMQAWLAARGLD